MLKCVLHYETLLQLHNWGQQRAAGADRRRGLRQGHARGARRQPGARVPAGPGRHRQVMHHHHFHN
jgi:hypothetical protein